jgi:hypothetical protein
MLTAAVFYGLLRKTKLFGLPEKNVAVNAIVALIAGFMVMAYPIIAGVSPETLPAFFFHGTVLLLVMVVALLVAGMFLPENLPKYIGEKIKTARGVGIIVIAGILIGGAAFVSSGLINVFIPSGVETVAETELITTIIVILILVGTVIVITYVGGGKK